MVVYRTDAEHLLGQRTNGWFNFRCEQGTIHNSLSTAASRLDGHFREGAQLLRDRNSGCGGGRTGAHRLSECASSCDSFLIAID